MDICFIFGVRKLAFLLTKITTIICYMTLAVQDSMTHCVLNIYIVAVSLIIVFISVYGHILWWNAVDFFLFSLCVCSHVCVLYTCTLLYLCLCVFVVYVCFLLLHLLCEINYIFVYLLKNNKKPYGLLQVANSNMQWCIQNTNNAQFLKYPENEQHDKYANADKSYVKLSLQ